MKTIAVIFGGRSAEHDVSIITAIASIIKPLEMTGEYQVEPVYIAKDGSWYWDQKLKDITLYQGGGIDNYLHSAPKVHLLFDNGLTLVKSSQFAGRKKYQKIDVVFPAMHGTYGEDGKLMGLLEMAGVPFVGCDTTSSALVMDKVLSKLQAQANHIPITTMQFFSKTDYERDASGVTKRVSERLQFPVFVKPAHLGSSIGITRVTDKKELVNAIEVAAHYDDKILVEEEVPNLIEVTLPIMGNDDLQPALLEQPMTKPGDFFDFETKYMNQGKGGKKMGGGTGEISGGKMGGSKRGAQGYSRIPADLPKELYKKAEDTALAVYRAMGCQGTARVDLLINGKTGEVYFNEVNPLPGSLYAHNWRAAGVSSIDLVRKLIRLAEERWQAQQKLATSFNTSFLKQF